MVETYNSLRTRIAAVVNTHEWHSDGTGEGQCDCDGRWFKNKRLYDFHLADAVIRELGLRIEYGALDPTDSGRLSDDDDLTALPGETLKTRYITDWHPHVADAVITELRPQLAAWARMCVDSGDMTPMAQRMLHKILGQA